MKTKISTLFLTLLAASTLFSACNKEDEADATYPLDDLYGTWEFTSEPLVASLSQAPTQPSNVTFLLPETLWSASSIEYFEVPKLDDDKNFVYEDGKLVYEEIAVSYVAELVDQDLQVESFSLDAGGAGSSVDAGLFSFNVSGTLTQTRTYKHGERSEGLYEEVTTKAYSFTASVSSVVKESGSTLYDINDSMIKYEITSLTGSQITVSYVSGSSSTTINATKITY